MTGVRDVINAGVRIFVIGGLVTCFDIDSDRVFLRLDELIELGFSDRYFESCSSGNIEVLVTGVQRGINSGVGRIF